MARGRKGRRRRNGLVNRGNFFGFRETVVRLRCLLARECDFSEEVSFSGIRGIGNRGGWCLRGWKVNGLSFGSTGLLLIQELGLNIVVF